MALGKVTLCLWLVGWSQICAGFELPSISGWGSSKFANVPDPNINSNPTPSTALTTSPSTGITSYMPSVPSFNDLKNSLPSLQAMPGYKSVSNLGGSLPSITNFPTLKSLPSLPNINVPTLKSLTDSLPLPDLNPILNLLSTNKLTKSPTFNEKTLSDAEKLKKELNAIGEDKSVEELIKDIQQANNDPQTTKVLVFAFTLARFALVASSFMYYPGVYAVIATKVLDYFLQQAGTPKNGDKNSEQNQYLEVINTVMKTIPGMQQQNGGQPPPDKITIHTKAGKDIVMMLPVADNHKRASFQLLDAIEVLTKLWNTKTTLK